MLADAEERDVKGRNEDHVVKAYFGSRGNDHLYAADTSDGALYRSITQGDERSWVHVWSHGVEKVPGVDHVSVGSTVDNECSGTTGAVTVEERSGYGWAAVSGLYRCEWERLVVGGR